MPRIPEPEIERLKREATGTHKNALGSEVGIMPVEAAVSMDRRSLPQ